MAKSAGGGAGSPDDLPQHPYVERLKPDPSQPAKRVVDLTGLPGNSDRPGYQRLYLRTKLDYYAEFLTSDMVHAEAVPLDQSPFPGLETTRVSIDREATIHYIWAKSPEPVDEFDLDVRLGTPGAFPTNPALPASPPDCQTVPHTCVCPTQATCPADATCAGHATCAAGATCAGHGTCVNTRCLQAACIFTQGGQATCANTQCAQHTCVTCPAAATCPQTCVG